MNLCMPGCPTVQDKAVLELPSTNPIRLGLALNFSVFYYEASSELQFLIEGALYFDLSIAPKKIEPALGKDELIHALGAGNSHAMPLLV